MKEKILKNIKTKYYEKYRITPPKSFNSPVENPYCKKTAINKVTAYDRIKQTKGAEFIDDLGKLKEDNDFTLQEMGDKYNLSRERIRQIFEDVHGKSLTECRKDSLVGDDFKEEKKERPSIFVKKDNMDCFFCDYKISNIDGAMSFFKKRHKILKDNLDTDELLDYGMHQLCHVGDICFSLDKRNEIKETLMTNLEYIDTGDLLDAVEMMAHSHFDGHYTILSFTTNYKGAFGTPTWVDFDITKPENRLDKCVTEKSLKMLLVRMLIEAPSFYNKE